MVVEEEEAEVAVEDLTNQWKEQNPGAEKISTQHHHARVTTKQKIMTHNQLTLETVNQHLKVILAAVEDTEEETIVDRSSESLKETAQQCEVAWAEEALMIIEATIIRVVEEASKQAEVALKRQSEEVLTPKASEALLQCHSKTR